MISGRARVSLPDPPGALTPLVRQQDADAQLVGWLEIYLVVAAIVGSPPAILAAARRHDPVEVVGVLVIGILGALVFVAGAVALMFNGYVEDTGMEPARTLHIAIPLLLFGIAVSAAAWRIAARA